MTITLATLSQATAQQVFNQVARHLLTQNAKCETLMDGCTEPRCRYRYGTLMCAAGCLISEGEYEEGKFEGAGWGRLVEWMRVPGAHSNLIRSLQRIHDNLGAQQWPSELAELAASYNLNMVDF